MKTWVYQVAVGKCLHLSLIYFLCLCLWLRLFRGKQTAAFPQFSKSFANFPQNPTQHHREGGFQAGEESQFECWESHTSIDCLFWFESKVLLGSYRTILQTIQIQIEVCFRVQAFVIIWACILWAKKRGNKESSSGEGYHIKIPQWIQRSDDRMSNMFLI